MISRKCCSLFSWHLPDLFYQWIYLVIAVIAVNLAQCPTCQAMGKTGDRRSRELETSILESSQNITETNPCFRFVDWRNKEFFSPGFADRETYTNSTDCVSIIRAEEGHLIKMDFLDYFHIELSPDCGHDYLEIRDGPYGYSNILERRFCGSDFPPIVTSSDRYLWVHFKSDENIEYRGFRAVLEFIRRPDNLKTPEIKYCEYESNDEKEGIFGKENISKAILNYSNDNSMPIDCLWTITVQENWRVQLQFEDFDLDKPNECDKNFVQVFNNKTDLDHIDKEFCGSIADTVLSKGNKMFVRFFAGPMVPKSTFRANFTAFREYDDKQSNTKSGCNPELEFDCEDATCIAKELKCNGRINCRFRWDEDGCPGTDSQPLSGDHITIIMVIFSLILSGMCFTFIFNCVKKLIRDHRTIQEYIRQSREQQLNELDKQEQVDKKLSKSASRSRSNSSHSSTSPHFDIANTVNTPCYVPGGELLPILIRNEHSMSPSNGDAYDQNIYTVDNENMPEMCDSACQTRESLFTTQGYSSGNSTPNHSVHTNSPPAPFSTFGYKKDNKFKAEARIEVAPKKKFDEKRRPYSVQTTKSAPDVIVTH